MHNTFAPFGIQDAGGYSSFYPRRYGEFLHLSQKGHGSRFPDNFSRWVYFKKFGSPLLDIINVKYVLLSASVKTEHQKLKLVYDGEIKIYENTGAFPRAFFVPTYQFCKSRTEAYDTLALYAASDFRKKVILESLPSEDFQQDDDSEKDAEHEVRLISYEPGRIEAEVSTNQNGFLVLSDNYHPAWRAEADGEETEILRANYIMRAIPIKSGDHKVTLTFHPKLRIAGIAITAVGWFAWLMILIFDGRFFKIHHEINKPPNQCAKDSQTEQG